MVLFFGFPPTPLPIPFSLVHLLHLFLLRTLSTFPLYIPRYILLEPSKATVPSPVNAFWDAYRGGWW